MTARWQFNDVATPELDGESERPLDGRLAFLPGGRASDRRPA